jgi:hypothetical protein
MKKSFALLTMLVTAAVVPLFAQPAVGTIKGQVSDPSAAAVPAATVTVRGEDGTTKQARTDSLGMYTIPGLAPGKYDVHVEAKGFNAFEALAVPVSTGAVTMNVPLTVAMETQSVTVSTDTSSVTTDPTQNVGQLVLKGEDLQTLSDDPDDLANDLQALAGPAAGPNGGQIYIDGFTGGQLPPKSAIREVRINSNPFSAEYDKLGFGRIEILTKPGSDRFHGQVFTNIGNEIFNSRNPFVLGEVPDYSQEFFGGNVSGPLGKKASFFFDMDRRITDENALIVAQAAFAPDYNIVPINDAVVTPRRRTSLSPRIDYQLSPNNTLSARYRWEDSTTVGGVGGFNLPALTSNTDEHNHTAQITETAVLGTHAVNETRFQFFNEYTATSAVNSGVPTINVQSSFTNGASPFSLNYTDEKHYEIQNYTTYTKGTHTVRFGIRVRDVQLSDQSTNGYNGGFTFAGGKAVELDPNTLQPVLDPSGSYIYTALQSIDQYRYTQLLLSKGVTAAQAAALGYAPNQFTLTSGIPLANVSQVDFGPFIQDDWRVRPNITISAGLRYEAQTNISDYSNVAPRIGVAWAPGGKKGAAPKTVIRAGAGMFYDRFSEDYTLAAERLNGITQQQYVVRTVNFYPNVPTPDQLTGASAPQAIRDIQSDLKAPRIFQTAIGVERQLPWRITLAVNWTRSRGWDELRSRNINAPLPGTWDPANPSTAVRPYGNIGDIYLYESSASFKQNQLMMNVQARLTNKLSLFGFYVYGHAESNSDGANTFPANQYDLSSEWGRAGFDIRHRMFLGGNIVAPLALTLNPFIIINSGAPFNITTGTDPYGSGLFTARPAFATDLTRPSVINTEWGAFDLNPLPGATIIPRNYGEGPGLVSINLRLSRSWGWGETKSSANANSANFGGPGGGGPRGGGGHGPGGGGGGFMTMGRGGMFGGAGNTAGKRYVLTLGVQARNVLNHVNYAPPIGVVSSPFFGESTATAGGFGGGAAGNRKIELQLRFTF